MIHAFRRSAGFTIIELSLVLIVMGVLAVALLPMAQVVHDDAMRETDQTTMDVAKNALMGYIRVNQAIPCAIPDPVTGDPVQIIPFGPANPTTPCDPTTTLDLLGVRTTDARGRTFALDVNDDLTVAGLTASGNTLCAALANIINPPPLPAPAPTLDPQVCEATNANTGNTACVAATTPTMTFVLAGRGSDRCLNLENTHASATNDAVCTTAVAANRTFENPVRIHSRTTDDGYYDDLIFALTPLELAEAMGCPAGGGGGGGFSYCPSGEKLVQVINGQNNTVSLEIAGLCYVVDRGTTASLGCQLDTTAIEVHDNPSCGSLFFSGTAGSLDSNSDGRTDVTCNRSTTCTSR